MKKKLLAISLALFFVIGLSSCQEEKAEDSIKDSETVSNEKKDEEKTENKDENKESKEEEDNKKDEKKDEKKTDLVVGNQEGNLAPNFELEAFDGKKYKLEDFKGKPLVIKFFASWCGPCVHEIPELVEVDKEFDDDKLQIIAINVSFNDDVKKAKELIDKNEAKFPVLMDKVSDISIEYGVRSLPTNFFIDKNGVIKSRESGMLDRHLYKELIKNIIE